MYIELCKSCEGTGVLSTRDWDYSYIETECYRCNGHGRVMSKTYTLEVPLDFSKKKLYELDEKIFDLVNVVKKNDKSAIT